VHVRNGAQDLPLSLSFKVDKTFLELKARVKEKGNYGSVKIDESMSRRIRVARY
jgi:hypothetical protein